MDDDVSAIDPLLKALAWTQGRLEWKLHAAQLKIHESIEALPRQIKHAVILCCRRFGKSYYGSARGTMNGLKRDRFLTRIIGPDIKQTVMIVEYNMAKITEELAAIGLRDLVRRVKSENMYEVGDSSAIFLGGFDSQRDSLRGGEADEILIEETGSSDPEQYSYMMRDVLMPQLLKTRGRMIDLTTLPPVPDHPFMQTIEQCQLDGAFYSYDIYQDPLATPEIIADAIKDCGGEQSDTFKREYLNKQVRDRSLVIIPDYDDAIDAKEEIVEPRQCHLELFTDWGGVRDFTVSLLMTYDFLAAKDLVLDELWWPNNTPTDKIKGEMAERWGKLPLKNWYADAAGQTLVDLNREQFEKDLQRSLKVDGLPHVRMPKKDDFEAAINNMANRVRHRKLKVHPQCQLLRMTCRSGVLNKHRTDFERSRTLGHMDAAAALMYGIRCLDRSNPYSVDVPSSEWTYVRPKRDEGRQSLVSVPKSFGVKGGKRFGA